MGFRTGTGSSFTGIGLLFVELTGRLLCDITALLDLELANLTVAI